MHSKHLVESGQNMIVYVSLSLVTYHYCVMVYMYTEGRTYLCMYSNNSDASWCNGNVNALITLQAYKNKTC